MFSNSFSREISGHTPPKMTPNTTAITTLVVTPPKLVVTWPKLVVTLVVTWPKLVVTLVVTPAKISGHIGGHISGHISGHTSGLLFTWVWASFAVAFVPD